MKADGFPIDLLDGGMVHGEQGRPFPALGRDLGDDVLAGETAREQPREDGCALLLRELLAVACVHGVSWRAILCGTHPPGQRVSAWIQVGGAERVLR